jgi:hypothetical protein
MARCGEIHVQLVQIALINEPKMNEEIKKRKE